VIGTASVMVTEPRVSLVVVGKAAFLFGLAVVFFAFGAVLCKGKGE